MADISGGETWVEGEQVTGGRLNNHVNGAVIQPAFVVSKTLMTSGDLAGNDSLLMYDLSATSLKRTTVTNLLALGGAGTVTSVALSLPADTFLEGGAVTTSGTLSATHIAQNFGEVHVGPVASNGFPTWRRLEPRDMRTAGVNIAAGTIDWNLGDVFYKIISANQNLDFANMVTGRTINVFIGQTSPGTSTVSWVLDAAGVLWPGGAAPVQTTGIGKWDWYQFTMVYSAVIFGVRIGANMS